MKQGIPDMETRGQNTLSKLSILEKLKNLMKEQEREVSQDYTDLDLTAVKFLLSEIKLLEGIYDRREGCHFDYSNAMQNLLCEKNIEIEIIQDQWKEIFNLWKNLKILLLCRRRIPTDAVDHWVSKLSIPKCTYFVNYYLLSTLICVVRT